MPKTLVFNLTLAPLIVPWGPEIRKARNRGRPLGSCCGEGARGIVEKETVGHETTGSKEYNPPPPERRFMEYLVVRCPRCSMPSAVRLGSLSHTCPYCGTRFKVNEVNIVARARNGREASELVRRMLAQGR